MSYKSNKSLRKGETIMKERIENVLKQNVSPEILSKMETEWKAFYHNPEKYSDSIVIEMVCQWIKEERND